MQMTVGRKLTLLGVFLIGLTAVLGVATLHGLRSYDKVVHALADDSLAGVSACSKAEASLLEMRGDMWRHIAATDSADVTRQEAAIDRLKSALAEDMKAIGSAIYADEERELNRKIEPALEAYYSAWTEVARLSRAQKNNEAYKLYVEQAAPRFEAAKAAIAAETEYNRRLGGTNTALAASTGARLQWTTIILLLAGIFAGGGTLLWIVRGLNQVLRQAVTELSEGATEVTSASKQVAATSQTLAQGSSEQAASLEQTSSSSEEISSMTAQNASNTARAATCVKEMGTRIEEGNRTLESMMESMREINAASENISKIIKAIDEIAFQTNILALNAAVEAARAGEAGMGFAVVADEVRNLAQRSAQAAKDTARLIDESIAKSNHGSSNLQQVAAAIHGLTSSAGEVKTLVDEINLGSQEQARGIEQIAKAVVQMQGVTQSSAASAEEGAAASEQLAAQAQALESVASRLGVLVGYSGRDAA